MSIKSSVHPLYSAMLKYWQKGLDCYEGSECIKQKGDEYLKPTGGMILDGYPSPGTAGLGNYEAYKQRAVFPDDYEEAINAAVGIIHKKPATIELPEALEYLRDKATPLGESLQLLLRKITTQQLKTGRIGILGDIRNNSFVILTYNELSILNWNDAPDPEEDSDTSFVLLDESGYQMDMADFTWKEMDRYRVLAFVNSQGVLDRTEGAVLDTYGSCVLSDSDSIAGAVYLVPNLQGQVSNKIPFVFINAKDLSPNPDKPPLRGLASICITIYNGEADYRQNLFMQGQDTLVKIGGTSGSEEPTRTGAGASISVPLGGDAKYIGVSSNGLAEQRSAIENDTKKANQKSGKLLNTTSGGTESGDALRIRVSAQTATLPEIAQAGAAGLEKLLKILAEWVGASPEEVIVKPNLEFADPAMDGLTLTQLVSAKSLGAPISEQSIHTWTKKQGFTELSYEEELALIASEVPKV